MFAGLPNWKLVMNLVRNRKHAMKLTLIALRATLIILMMQQEVHVLALEIQQLISSTDDYIDDLQQVLVEIMKVVHIKRCLVIITDDMHLSLYDHRFYQRLRMQYFVKVDESEDLLAPSYQIVRVLKEIHKFDCDLHFVTLFNGIQVKRFLRFNDRYRMLNTRAKFIFLHDELLFDADMLKIWSTLVSNLFLKKLPEHRFSISTVPYPNILNGIVVTKVSKYWQKGKDLRNVQIFPTKLLNLRQIGFPVVVMEHVPMVSRSISNADQFEGVEVEIVRALGKSLNFKPSFYVTSDSETERWGRELPNGSFTGLIGQMTNRTARIAIGDLHLNKLHSAVMDLSMPHSLECLTFLTPESSQDNSWKTLIQPFSGGMWTGVLLSLFMVGTVFYTISWMHALALGRHLTSACKFFAVFRRETPPVNASLSASLYRDVKFRANLNRMRVQPKNEDLFDNFANCVLLTYSMLMFVALPRMPRNWPLRVLTGWYWLYCILLTVTYRASFTAILANPVARITIDTLEELAKSRITATAWGDENKKFFAEAFDQIAQEISVKMELIDDLYGVTDQIAKGTHAYYDNEFYLRHLRLMGSKRREDDEVLHVMHDCVVHMPIALGLEKNSPLKPYIDMHLLYLREGGLISKWLSDAIVNLPTEEQISPEAIIDLHKFWSSFVALGIGYFFGICAFFAEKLHFKYIVESHPLYDKYNPRLYYNFKRHFTKSYTIN